VRATRACSERPPFCRPPVAQLNRAIHGLPTINLGTICPQLIVRLSGIHAKASEIAIMQQVQPTPAPAAGPTPQAVPDTGAASLPQPALTPNPVRHARPGGPKSRCERG
jgi:hypothetical protein